MQDYKTQQEQFWAGAFGTEYATRNLGPRWVASNLSLFAKVLTRTVGVRSVLEFGANIGLNLQAIGALLPEASMTAVEINAAAVEVLKNLPRVKAILGSMLVYEPAERHDFVLVKGVLIHQDPTTLPEVYDLLAASSSRYVCIVEYYNPAPVALPYRGHENRLFKRDFAGEFLARRPEYSLLEYGFVYRGDANFPQDDVTWFLLSK
jgi:pseudaminic acid biosynthesis-associated methylase